MISRVQRNIPKLQWSAYSILTGLIVFGLITLSHPKGLVPANSKLHNISTVATSESGSRDQEGRIESSDTSITSNLVKRNAESDSTTDLPDNPEYSRSTTPNNTTENQTERGEHHRIKSHGGVHVADWKWEYVKTPFIYTAFIITAGLCKILYHHADFLSSIIPESCLLIVLGTAVGGILFVTGSENIVPRFDSKTFFLFLLPPIILESAYSLHDRAFFSNLGTILLYAVVGTLLNTFTIGPTLYGLYSVGALGENLSLGPLECLVFSALISAVDPVAVLAIFQEVGVHKALYFLVFGESLLNDAVTVVLYTMMVALASEEHITAGQLGLGVASFFCVSLGGLLIGVIMGTLTALVTKKTNNVRVVEPLAMLGVAYLAYLLAEMVHFSGIISIIGCGLVQAQYAWCNISQKSYTTVKYFSKMLSAVCDTIIFLFLGMVLVNDHHNFNVGFVLWSTLLCLLFRFIGVLLLTYITNTFDRVRRINYEEQFIMAYGGLRGAVAFSLVIMLDKQTIPNKDMFVTTTLFIILFTVFIQGATIKPLVNLLKIRLQTGHKHSLIEEINTKVVDSVMAGIEEITGSHGDNYWKHILFKYDEKYMKKWLQRDCHDNVLTRVYTKMVLADHFAHLYGPATVIEDNQPLSALREDNHPDEEDILSISCPRKDLKANADPSVKQVRFKNEETRRLSGQVSMPNRRRNTIITPLTSFKRRGNTAPSQEDPSKILQKALQLNPYNKFHLKYNPNLVEDDHQEITAHLRARRLRARRLTLTAMSSLGSSPSSSLEDLRSRNAVSDIPVELRAMTAPASELAYKKGNSPINGQTINFLLDRANRRRSIMSGRARSSLMERGDTLRSETDTLFGCPNNTDEMRRERRQEEDKRKNSSSMGQFSFGSVDSVTEIRSLPEDNDQKEPPKKIKKALTFDVSSLDSSLLMGLEKDSKF